MFWNRKAQKENDKAHRALSEKHTSLKLITQYMEKYEVFDWFLLELKQQKNIFSYFSQRLGNLTTRKIEKHLFSNLNTNSLAKESDLFIRPHIINILSIGCRSFHSVSQPCCSAQGNSAHWCIPPWATRTPGTAPPNIG